MPALTSAELEDMRTHAEEYLSGTCTIQYDRAQTSRASTSGMDEPGHGDLVAASIPSARATLP